MDILEVYLVALAVAGSVLQSVYLCLVRGPNVHDDMGENAAELRCGRNINFPLRQTDHGRRAAVCLNDGFLFKDQGVFSEQKEDFFASFFF